MLVPRSNFKETGRLSTLNPQPSAGVDGGGRRRDARADGAVPGVDARVNRDLGHPELVFRTAGN